MLPALLKLFTLIKGNDFFFQAQKIFVQALRILGAAEDKHLHLRKLMHSVQTLGELAVTARFPAEAVRKSGVFQRKALLLQDLAGLVSPQRDLGGAD